MDEVWPKSQGVGAAEKQFVAA